MCLSRSGWCNNSLARWLMSKGCCTEKLLPLSQLPQSHHLVVLCPCLLSQKGRASLKSLSQKQILDTSLSLAWGKSIAQLGAQPSTLMPRPKPVVRDVCKASKFCISLEQRCIRGLHLYVCHKKAIHMHYSCTTHKIHLFFFIYIIMQITIRNFGR